MIVGDMGREKSEVVGNARERGMAVRWWEEIWEVAEKVTQEKVEYPSKRLIAGNGQVH